MVAAGMVELQGFVDDAEHGAALTGCRWPAPVRPTRRRAGRDRSDSREDLRQHVAGAGGHVKTVQLRCRHPAGLGNLGAVGAQFAADGTGTVVEDHVVIVARADTDVFVNIDQPLDMHFQPNLFAHLAVQGFEQRLAVVDLPPASPIAARTARCSAGSEGPGRRHR